MAGPAINPVDALLCAAVGLGGGLIQNIVNPTQRGFAGFVSAACVGTFCGFVGGLIASELNWTSGIQWICSAAAGVFGFAVLQGVFSMIKAYRQGQVNVYGGQNMIGNNQVQGDMHSDGTSDEPKESDPNE